MSNEDTKVLQPISDHEIANLEVIGKLFFAYRDFVSDPDLMLETYGFGRAHHRVMFFVNRQPGLTVAELLETLRITKQSLSRVLKQLIETGYISQLEGQSDRRKRLIYPTMKGRELILSLSKPQSERITAALDSLNASEKQAVSLFLSKMTNDDR